MPEAGFNFDGKTVVITGGSGGIGAAVLKKFSRLGANVFNLDLNPGEDLPGRFYQVDVTRQSEVQAAVDGAAGATGRLDYVIACAGITRDAVTWKLSEEDWREVLAVNLDGTYHLLKAAIPYLRHGSGGSIVFVSSVSGERGRFGQANYTASKAGMIGLAKTAARELGRFNVRVNVVSPGFINTPMTKPLPLSVADTAVEEAVLGRIGLPEEVADAVLYFCSGMSTFITGQVLRVDGGKHM